MNKRERLNKVLDEIKIQPEHYFARSLYKDYNELLILCDHIIDNNVKNIIEIGTYKGVTAAIFAAIIDGKVHTINVDDKEIEQSKNLWNVLRIDNIVQYKGSSLDILPQLVKDLDDVNFVYVDGDHDIPYAATEFDIIAGSKIMNDNCLVYFDDGPLPGVKQAIEKHHLHTITGVEWMRLDEANKGGGGTVRAYITFGDFKVEWGK